MAQLSYSPKGKATFADWQHAAKLFVANNYARAPKSSFLYHVYFEFNDVAKKLNLVDTFQSQLGMMVKQISLPGFTVDTKTLNAYNRPHIVQTKVHYDPVNITFHDDMSDIVRDFWFDYYAYYYRNSDYGTSKDFANYGKTHDEISGPRLQKDWGYTMRGTTHGKTVKVPYLNAIRIYSLYNKQFSEYILINPLIKTFKHGQHNAAGSADILEHQMTVEYESVIYARGTVNENNVLSFGDSSYYDNADSPLKGLKEKSRSPRVGKPDGSYSGGANDYTGTDSTLFYDDDDDLEFDDLETGEEDQSDFGDLPPSGFAGGPGGDEPGPSSSTGIIPSQAMSMGQNILGGSSNPFGAVGVPMVGTVMAQVGGIASGKGFGGGISGGVSGVVQNMINPSVLGSIGIKAGPNGVNMIGSITGALAPGLSGSVNAVYGSNGSRISGVLGGAIAPGLLGTVGISIGTKGVNVTGSLSGQLAPGVFGTIGGSTGSSGTRLAGSIGGNFGNGVTGALSAGYSSGNSSANGSRYRSTRNSTAGGSGLTISGTMSGLLAPGLGGTISGVVSSNGRGTTVAIGGSVSNGNMRVSGAMNTRGSGYLAGSVTGMFGNGISGAVGGVIGGGRGGSGVSLGVSLSTMFQSPTGIGRSGATGGIPTVGYGTCVNPALAAGASPRLPPPGFNEMPPDLLSPATQSDQQKGDAAMQAELTHQNYNYWQDNVAERSQARAANSPSQEDYNNGSTSGIAGGGDNGDMP